MVLVLVHIILVVVFLVAVVTGTVAVVFAVALFLGKQRRGSLAVIYGVGCDLSWRDCAAIVCQTHV